MMQKAMKLITLAGLCLLGTAFSAQAEEAEAASGLSVGEATLSFTVMDVTGAYAGKRICYVCEYQDEPNVIGFFQDANEEAADMIVRLNDLYRENKDRGLQAFAVIVSGTEASPWLEELNQSKDIEIPLVVLRKGPKDLAVRMYRLDPELSNTFLVNINREVMANFSGIATGEFDLVADAATRMLADNNL